MRDGDGVEVPTYLISLQTGHNAQAPVERVAMCTFKSRNIQGDKEHLNKHLHCSSVTVEARRPCVLHVRLIGGDGEDYKQLCAYRELKLRPSGREVTRPSL
jgi:hypothetical protein